MAEVLGTGSYEEEMLRQQREAERLAREQAKRAEEAAAKEVEKAQAEASKAEETAQDEAKAAASAAAEAASDVQKTGAKVDIGPTNQPFTEEQSFLLHQRKAVRESDWDVVRVGELDKLPEQLEPHREMLEKRNRKGQIIPGDLTDWGENKIAPRYSSFKDNDQAAYFASTLESADDIKKFFKEYADYTNQDYEKVLSYSEDLLGNRLFDEPLSKTNRNKAIMNGMNSYDLIGYGGNAINFATDNLTEIMRAIKAHPDPEVRAEMADWLEKASQQEGNRFYGITVDKTDLKKYNDTAALPSWMYTEFADGVDAVFDPTPGREEANEEKYQELMADIDDPKNNYTDYQKHYLRQAVERGYKKQLGVSHAKVGEEAAAQAVMEPAEPEKSHSEAMPKGMRWVDNAPGFKQEAAEAVSPFQAMDNALDYELADVGHAQLPAEGSVNLVDDPVRAVTQYVNNQRGNELDIQTRDAVNDLVKNSTAAQVVMGFDWTGSDELYKQAQNDPFALARANEARREYLTGDVSNVLGSTLGGFYAQIQEKNFPEELRDDALGAILQIGLDAETAYKNGEFSYDTENGILYEAYVEQHPEVLAPMHGVFEDVNELQRIDREKKKLAADEAAKAEAELLRQSIAAVQTGFFTQADIDRVLNAAPVVTIDEARTDETYNRIMQEIALDRTLSDGVEDGFYNEHAIDYMMGMGMSGDLNTMAAVQYKDTLQGFVEAELLNDERIARSLDYDGLDAYYAKQGGFSMENLYARAAVSMQNFGKSLTDDDMAVAEQLYTGTGEDVGFLDVYGGGAAQGAMHAASEALEGIWMMSQASVEERADAVISTRNQYVDTYGAAVASYMYEQDILKWAEEGDFPNAEYPKYLKTYIASGLDPFQLGVVPDTSSLILKGAVKADKAVEAAGVWAQEHMTPEQGRKFEVASATAGNTMLQAMATTITAMTGSPLIGTFSSFGLLSAYPEEMREQLKKVRSMSEANAMGMTHAVTTALAEYETSGMFSSKLFKALGFPSAMTHGAAMVGKPGAAKTVAGMAKAFGKGFVKGAGQMAVGELVTDELKDKLLWDFAGGTLDAKLNGARWAEAIFDGLTGMDTGGAVEDVIGAIPQGLIYMSPMIFMGGISDGFSATRRAAQKLASTGTPEAAKEFVNAAQREIKDPENRAAFNAAMDEIQTGQIAAGMMAADPEIAPITQNAQKVQEQRISHQEELAASEERLKNDEATFEACEAEGDVDGAVAAFADIPKAQQGINEHKREAEQKQIEEDRLFEEATTKAIAKAKGYVANSKRLSMQVLSDRIAAIETPEDKLNAIDEQLAIRGQDIIDADEAGDTAAYEQAQAEFTQLLEQQEAITASMQQTDAVQTARGEAEAALANQDAKEVAALEEVAQRERMTEEKATMAPVYRDLRTRPVYVDKQQAANIKSATGLNISQFNRKYGMKLVTKKDPKASSLDGGFFADLAQQAPGYIDAETLHPEEALIALAERKKELAGVKASLGETNADAYITDVTLGTDDPVTMKMASDLKKSTGVDLVTANLEDGVRGWYDRANNQLVLSNKLGAGEMRRVVVMHELTHFIENSPGYDAYKKAVLDAAYEGGEEYRKNQLERDRQDVVKLYAEHGVSLTADEIDYELVAAATERVIDGDEAFFEGLINGGKRSLVQRVYLKVKQFLAKHKAKKAGPEMLEYYERVQKAHDLMEAALQSAPKGAKSDGKVQYMLVDIGENSKGVYESNFPKGTPKQVKQARLVQLWQNVWSQQPIELNIKDANGEERPIIATFDPDYDPANVRMTDLGKVMSNRNGSSGDRNVTLDLADDLYDLARTSEYITSEDETGKQTATHKDVKRWHYFFNDIIYRNNAGDDIPYTVWLDVKEKDDGGYVYQLYAKKTKKDATTTASNAHQNPLAGISQSAGQVGTVPNGLGTNAAGTSISNSSVQQNGSGVNNPPANNGIQLSVGIRQMGNNTMQRADFISDRVKELVKDSEYERDTNEDQVNRATQRMDSLGGADAAAAVLLNKEKKNFTADDNALAFVAMAEATRNGDDTTAAMIAMRMLEESTEQGRALQSLQIGLKLTPEGVMAETIRKADRKNESKGVPAGSFPVGESQPKKGGTERRADGSVARTPEEVEKVYRNAEEVNAQLAGMTGEVSYDNPWQLPLNDLQMFLIRHYNLTGENLPGTAYNVASRKQRMLAAIIAAGNEVQTEGQAALCQQLEAIKAGYAVTTKADLMYIRSQMSEFKLVEGAQATTPKTQQGREALGRAYQAQDNVTQEGLMSKWSALRFMNMLSAPATAVRNVVSNVLASGLENASTALASVFDEAMSKKTGTRTTATANKAEAREGNKAFADETARTFMDYFVRKVDTGHGRKYAVGGKGRVFQTEWLEGCRNLVDFAMQIGDRPFFEKTYAQELEVVKRLGMKVSEMKDGKIVQRAMTETEMHEEATARALKRVFQEDNVVVSAMNSLKAKNPAWDLFISTLMPFIKTPTNIAMRAVEYSPVGFGITLARRAIRGLDTGKSFSISQRDYVMGLGRGLTGSGLMAAGYALASSGLIGFGRGEEENEKRRGVLSVLGEPYSMYIQIGDTKHEIDWALPMSSALAMGAELYKNLMDGEGLADAVGGAIINGVGEQIMDTPMLSAMNDIFRGYDDTENTIMRVAKTGATSLVNQTLSPAAIRALAKATDPYVRDTSSQSGVWSTLNQSVVQYWPGLRQMLPIKADMTGDDQLQSGYWNPKGEHGNAMMQMLDSFFTPTATIGEKNDPELIELLDLSYRTGESAFLPADLISAQKYELKLNKTDAKALRYGDEAITMTLTDEEKRSINAQHGDLLFNGDGGRAYRTSKGKTISFPGLRAVMEDKARYSNGSYKQTKPWSRMTDEERVTLVDKMRTDAKALVTVDVAKRKKEAGEL